MFSHCGCDDLVEKTPWQLRSRGVLRIVLGSCLEAKKPASVSPGRFGAALLTRGASRQGCPEFGLVALVHPPQASSQEHRPSRPIRPR
jgi:hypothetical protein